MELSAPVLSVAVVTAHVGAGVVFQIALVDGRIEQFHVSIVSLLRLLVVHCYW